MGRMACAPVARKPHVVSEWHVHFHILDRGKVSGLPPRKLRSFLKHLTMALPVVSQGARLMYLSGGFSERTQLLQFVGRGAFQLICSLLFSFSDFYFWGRTSPFDTSSRHLSAFEIFLVSRFLSNSLNSFVSFLGFHFVNLSCSAFASRNIISNLQCIRSLSRLAMIFLIDQSLHFFVLARMS